MYDVLIDFYVELIGLDPHLSGLECVCFYRMTILLCGILSQVIANMNVVLDKQNDKLEKMRAFTHWRLRHTEAKEEVKLTKKKTLKNDFTVEEAGIKYLFWCSWGLNHHIKA